MNVIFAKGIATAKVETIINNPNPLIRFEKLDIKNIYETASKKTNGFFQKINKKEKGFFEVSIPYQAF